MCGLAGAVAFAPARVDEAAVERAALGLAHRGPDGDGLLALRRDAASDLRHGAGRRALAARPDGLPALEAEVTIGHRRLAIIDLSEQAAQPFAFADDRYVLAWNGEIYNHVELRADLARAGHAMRTASDTEVFVAAWATWGAAALERFTGMFAFALVDRRDGVLWLGRDAFGMKPLFWSETAHGLVFASEVREVLALAGRRARVAPGPLGRYLQSGVTDADDATMFEGVRSLAAGHLLRMDLRARAPAAPERWSVPDATPISTRPVTELAEELRALLLDSVRLHLRSDVPIATFLSGGVDSSAIAACARAVLGPDAALRTLSYRPGMEARSEGAWIDAVNAHIRGTPVPVAPLRDDLDAAFDALVARQGEPFTSPAIFVQAALFRAAAGAGVRVVLDGQGADELFGGYAYARVARLAGLIRHGEFAAARRLGAAFARGGHDDAWRGAVAMLAAAPVQRWRTWRGAAAYGPLANAEWMRARDVAPLPPWRPVGRDVLHDRLQDGLRVTSVPALVRYADRSAMAVSVENRLPFLTTTLARFAARVPDDQLVADDGTGKPLLRAALRGLVPDPVLDRREKVGFAVPWGPWLERSPRMAAWVASGARLPFIDSRMGARLALAVRAGAPTHAAERLAAWRLAGVAAWVSAYDVGVD